MENTSFFTFFDLFGYIGPFGPLPNFLGRTNHINLTRRIDPRYPESPNSPISQKIAFSFFPFLGFGGGEVPGGMVQGRSWEVGGRVQGRSELEGEGSRERERGSREGLPANT